MSNSKSVLKKEDIFKIVLTAMLISINIVLERFLDYSVWNLSLNFGAIPIAFAACYLGIPYAMAVGGLGDLLGAIIKPFGAYFVGYTITNLLIGLIIGIFIKKANLINITLGVLTCKLFCSLLLNTFWIAFTSSKGMKIYWAVLVNRAPAIAVMAVIEIVLIFILFSEKSHISKRIRKTINSLTK